MAADWRHTSLVLTTGRSTAIVAP